MDEKEASAQALTPPRREPWDKCGIEEKVERLRQELLGLRWILNDIRRRSRDFENHQHDVCGSIVVPLRSKYDGQEAMGRDLLA